MSYPPELKLGWLSCAVSVVHGLVDPAHTESGHVNTVNPFTGQYNTQYALYTIVVYYSYGVSRPVLLIDYQLSETCVIGKPNIAFKNNSNII